MCGRFTQHYTWRELVETYRLTDTPLNLEPRYNIAPTTDVLTIRAEGSARTAAPMRWGLIPSWWDQTRRLPATFNARADTVATKPMFRSAFKSRRCIVPMSGFYEWKTEGNLKRPFYVTMASGEPMSVAGLWEAVTWDGKPTLSCTIITTDANETMAQIHDRMPVVLGKDDWGAWLSAKVGLEVLRPCPNEWIKATEVSSYVNKVSNQGPRCLER